MKKTRSVIAFRRFALALSWAVLTPLHAIPPCPVDNGPAPVPQHGVWIAAPEHNQFFDTLAEMLSLLLEIAQRYAIAGIQGDDRLPALPSAAGYNPGTVAHYAVEHGGKSPPLDAKNAGWLAWRAAKLNAFMQRLHGALKAARPRLQISMSPSPFPWGYEAYLQDWPTWLRAGWVDTVSPQLYRHDLASYEAELHKITREQVCSAQLGRVFPGLLLALGREYLAAPELVRGMVAANRREGVLGEVFFHSEGLEQLPLPP